MYIPCARASSYTASSWSAIREGRYDQDQLELMVALGNNAIIALQNAQLYQTLREERDRLISKEDEVRRQLARDLHDGPAQVLAQIAMQVDFIKKLLERAPERVPNELDELADKARRANQDVRTLLFELRPVILESAGLVAALESYVQRFPPDRDAARPLQGPTRSGMRLAPGRRDHRLQRGAGGDQQRQEARPRPQHLGDAAPGRRQVMSPCRTTARASTCGHQQDAAVQARQLWPAEHARAHRRLRRRL